MSPELFDITKIALSAVVGGSGVKIFDWITNKDRVKSEIHKLNIEASKLAIESLEETMREIKSELSDSKKEISELHQQNTDLSNRLNEAIDIMKSNNSNIKSVVHLLCSKADECEDKETIEAEIRDGRLKFFCPIAIKQDI